MLLTAFIAGVGLRIVDAQVGTDAADVSLGDVGVRSLYFNVGVGAMLHSLRHRTDEVLAAVRIDGMIAEMVGNKHTVEPTALSHSASDGKHDAIAERNNGRLHVLLSVIALGNGVGTFKQR